MSMDGKPGTLSITIAITSTATTAITTFFTVIIIDLRSLMATG